MGTGLDYSPARDRKLDAMAAGWNVRDRERFRALRLAAGEFFKDRACLEANLEATHEVQELAFLENDLISTLQRYERGELPKFSVEDLKAADAALEAAFARTQTSKIQRWGTVTPEGIRKTQEAWISYRDAWLAFGKKYSRVSAASWRTWLAQQRSGMLSKFAY